MIGTLLKKIFGSQNERNLKRIVPLVDLINEEEPKIQRLNDEELRGKTAEFRGRLGNGEPSTICCPKPLPWCGRLQYAPWGCVPSTCR